MLASLIVTPQTEERQTAIVVSLRGFRRDGDRVRKNFFCLREMSAIEFGHTKQMQGIEVVRQTLKDVPASRLGVRTPALAIGCHCRRKQSLCLFFELLLQPCVLKGSRTGICQALGLL